MTETAPIACLQDYILDISTEKAQLTTYKLVLQNNTDFIVSRSTLKAERELVILISQGVYYIKNKKNGAIESVTLSSLKSFLRDLKDGLKMDEVHWMHMLCNTSAETIDRIITNDTYTDMCRHNVLEGIPDPLWLSGYWRQSSKLFMQLHDMFPTITDTQKYAPAFPLIFELNSKYGYNEAVYFASQLVQSGIERLNTAAYSRNIYGQGAVFSCEAFMAILENPAYNLQLRRLTDYLLFDLYAQGISCIDDFIWREYRDYLELQTQFYGKVKEKYPQSLKTAHDIITLKVNQVKAVQECKNFEERAKEVEHLAHQGSEYSIIVPTRPEELAEEGVSLSHCVKSYISRVGNGECHILFLRKTNSPEQSLVTLQLVNKGICQAQGYNRRTVTKEERSFLCRWAAEKGIHVGI